MNGRNQETRFLQPDDRELHNRLQRWLRIKLTHAVEEIRDDLLSQQYKYQERPLSSLQNDEVFILALERIGIDSGPLGLVTLREVADAVRKPEKRKNAA